MQKLLNKKQAFEISATVVISVLAVTAFVFGATTIGTNVSTGGTLTVSGLSSLGQATSTMLTVSGKTYLSSTLDVTGAATLSSTLGVTGKTTLGNATTSILTVTGSAYFDSAITANSTLNVTGLTTLTYSTTTAATVTNFYPTNVYGFTLQGNIAGNSKTITALSQLTVTGTTATSTFATSGLTVGTDQFAIQQSSGKIGIGTTTFSSFITATGGTSATTTVEFGDQYTTGSKTCFNVKTNLGASASFYVVGTAIVVEAERCE